MGLYVTDPARAVVEFGLLLAALPLQRALPTLFPERTSPRALTLIHPHIRRESG